MRYCLEFGVRGGAHTENLIVPSGKLAAQFCAKLVMVFKNDPHADGAKPADWYHPTMARAVWQSDTHFVAMSKLDGVMRGPASAILWCKPLPGEYTTPIVRQHWDR